VESRAQVLGHSLHQILIVFPLGLLTTSVGFDVAGLMTREARWPVMSYYMILVGLLGGVAAIVCGYIDYRAIPEHTRAKRIGRLHGWGGLAMMLFFAISVYLRSVDPSVLRPIALACSLAGLLLITITGWLGGELVSRMGIGVADHAHLNAPSSFSSRRSHARPIDPHQVASASDGVVR
jgi:uncharacterized membrane protein